MMNRVYVSLVLLLGCVLMGAAPAKGPFVLLEPLTQDTIFGTKNPLKANKEPEFIVKNNKFAAAPLPRTTADPPPLHARDFGGHLGITRLGQPVTVDFGKVRNIRELWIYNVLDQRGWKTVKLETSANDVPVAKAQFMPASSLGLKAGMNGLSGFQRSEVLKVDLKARHLRFTVTANQGGTGTTGAIGHILAFASGALPKPVALAKATPKPKPVVPKPKPTPPKPTPPKPKPVIPKPTPPKPTPPKPKPVQVAKATLPKRVVPLVKPIEVATLTMGRPVTFQEHILPIFRRHCIACHNEKDDKGGLILESTKHVLMGGDSGPSAKAGQSQASLLLQLASHHAKPFMPPPKNKRDAKPLSPQQLGLIKLWINQGLKEGSTVSQQKVNWSPIPESVRTILSVDMTESKDLVTANFANRIGIFHLPSSQLVSELADPGVDRFDLYENRPVAHLGMVQTLAFHPSGRLLATGGFRTVKLWHWAETEKLADLPAGTVRSSVLTSDGQWLVNGMADGKIRILDAKTGKLTRTLAGHTGAVTGVLFFGIDATLFSASADKSVRAWNLAGGSELWKLETPEPIRAFAVGRNKPLQAIAPNDSDSVKQTKRAANMKSRVVITAGNTPDMALWAFPSDTATEPAKPIRILKGHTKKINGMVTGSLGGGTVLMSGSDDGNIGYWLLTNGQLYKSSNKGMNPAGAPVTALAVFPKIDGQPFRLVSGGGDGSVKIWNAAGQVQSTVMGGVRESRMMEAKRRYVFDAKHIVLNTKRDLEKIEKAIKPTEDAIKSNQAKLASYTKTAAEDKPKVGKIRSDQAAAQQKLNAAQVAHKAAVAKEKQALAESEKDNSNQALAKAAMESTQARNATQNALGIAAGVLNKTRDKAAQDQIRKYVYTTEHMAFHQRELVKFRAQLVYVKQEHVRLEKEVAATEAAYQKTQAALADAPKALASAGKPIRGLAISADGSMLSHAGDDGTIHVSVIKGGIMPLETITGQKTPVTALTFVGPRRLAAFSSDDRGAIWRAWPRWTIARALGAPDDPRHFPGRVMALDFSPDGKTLVTACGVATQGGELKFWSVADGRLIRTITKAHEDLISDVKYSHNGRFVASCGGDSFSRVFDVSSGTELDRFQTQKPRTNISWRGDDRILNTAGQSGHLRFYEAPGDSNLQLWKARGASQNSPGPSSGMSSRNTNSREIARATFVGQSRAMVSVSLDPPGKPHFWEPGPNGGRNVYYEGIVRGQRERIQFTQPWYAMDVKPNAANSPNPTVAAGGQEGVLYVWSTTQPCRRFTLPSWPAQKTAQATTSTGP